MSGLQFGRRASLVVAAGESGLDLSQLHFEFEVSAEDVEFPNSARIRVFNPADSTANAVATEYQRVILQAGYEGGNFGVIFDGTIKQVRRGKVNATDRYVEILAADGDVPYNFAVISKTLAAGSGPQQQYDAIRQALGLPAGGYAPDFSGGTLPRGKVMFGLAKERARDFAATQKVSWSIQGGQLVMIPLTGYRPGEAVVLSATTGMIGLPEQTQEGIRARCLINPLIGIGTLVQIAATSIQTLPLTFDRATVGNTAAQQASLQRVAQIDSHGLYRTLVVEHRGDTRGEPWWSDLTCLSVDPSAPIDDSVPGG